jgi:hypothetical protein
MIPSRQAPVLAECAMLHIGRAARSLPGRVRRSSGRLTASVPKERSYWLSSADREKESLISKSLLQ